MFTFHDLTDEVRRLMLAEAELDIGNGTVYLSERFTDAGCRAYPDLLRRCLPGAHGERDLSRWLDRPEYWKTTEERNVKGNLVIADVPHDRHEVYAWNEFNVFYMRALCVRELAASKPCVLVYRAKQSANPRSSAIRGIAEGDTVSCDELLDDLRHRVGYQVKLGLGRPNSGLSVRGIQ